MNSERPTMPCPSFDPLDAYRAAKARNENSKPARGVPFQGCERPTMPVPAPVKK